MKLREWVFGGKDFQTMLDPSVYSNQDLKKDKHKLDTLLKKYQQEMDKHARGYKNLIAQGAEASAMERQNVARRARMEKQKYNQKKQLFLMSSTKLAAILSIEMAREMRGAMEGADTEFDVMFQAEEAQDIQRQVLDTMAEMGVQNEVLEDFVETLNIPVVAEGPLGESEEEELMDRLSQDKLSAEELDIEGGLDEEFDLEEMEVSSDFDLDEAAV
jgi:hypothetical protein